MSSQDQRSSGASAWVPPIDTSVAHPARRYDYWLGGKDNFAADRESGDAIAAKFPAIRTAVVENRRFLRRAVTFLTEEAGIRQFLDIGTGLPTANNTHEVAQAIAIVGRLVDALPAGSYLAISHATSDYLPPALVADIASGRHGQGRLRTEAEFTRFFDGLELVPPGVVPLAEWRAEHEPPPRPSAAETAMYAALGRAPG